MLKVSQTQVLVEFMGQGLVSVKALKDEDRTLTTEPFEGTGFVFVYGGVTGPRECGPNAN